MIKYKSAFLFPFILAVTVLIAASAGAVFIEERLKDPAQEARARDIAEGIRCLVCQNQSIMDSNAGLAKDLRGIVRERVQAGDSDDQVRHYLVSRYGDWVLLNPPFKLRTFLLWLGPLFVFVGGGIAMALFLRRKNVSREEKQVVDPLNAQEQAELDLLLRPADKEEQQ